MSKTIMDGGIHLSFEMRLDAEQIAKMRPQLVTALMRGVADIVTVTQFVDSMPKAPADDGGAR